MTARATLSRSVRATSCFLLLLLPALLSGAALATGADVTDVEADAGEPPLVTAYKRQQFKYYTGDVYEFRRRSAPLGGQHESLDDESFDNEIGWIQPRYRRQAASSERQQIPVLELLVVVDNGLYQAHMNRIEKTKSKQSVKTYYEYFVGYINKVFENVSPKINITVVPAGIAVIKQKNARDWSERNRVTIDGRDFILAGEALKQFRNWLERHRRRLPPFDHAVALTQYETGIKVGDTVHEIKGIAQLGQMCKVGARINSVSLVHDAGTLSGALTAVHEIAHSFGVNHDGEREAASCPDDGQFVMSAALAMSETATKFSVCSQRLLQRFLDSANAGCLFKSESSSGRHLVETNLLPGQIYSKDFQCQRQPPAGFKEPRFCKMPWSTPTTLEISCTALYCQDGSNPGSSRCGGSVPAIMGTPCGNKKICLNNRCTFSPTAPCCPLEEEDTASCTRMQRMGMGCHLELMRLYCCRFCGHACDS